MSQLLLSPWDCAFEQLIATAQSSLILCSPYIGVGPANRIVRVVNTKPNRTAFSIRLLTDLSRDNIVSGSTDLTALLTLASSGADVEIRFLPSLHAKTYVADDAQAVVTSGNLTESGLCRNIEYGVLFTDPSVVRQIRHDTTRFALLGSPIDREQLMLLIKVVEAVQEIASTAQRRLNRKIRQEFEERLALADIEILRARAAGRTIHAIFAETILYLLRNGPLATVEIHRHIQSIHPDLCDDAVDRVIDGQHFGKRWKHEVRSAQVYLRRSGRIHLSEQRWHRMDENQ